MSEATLPEPAFFHPSGRAYRFTVLLFVGLVTYGSYFAYDCVGAIPEQLMKTWSVSQDGIGGLYSIYSLAAIITLLFSGILIDRIGARKASLLFSALVTIGAVVVAFAPTIAVALAGRFIFGWGSESLVVAQNAILARWFKGKELAFSFGATLTISRLGTLFSFNTEALIAERLGASAALWAAALLCGLSLLANLVYALMDVRAARILVLKDEATGEDLARVWDHRLWFVVGAGVLLTVVRYFGYIQYFDLMTDCTILWAVIMLVVAIAVSVIAKLPPAWWFVSLLCVTFYSAIFPFTALSTDLFASKWGLPNTQATGLGFFQAVFSNFANMFSTAPGTSSIIIFASMCFAPFAGGLVDRIGRRASMMILGSLLMIPAHLLVGLTHFPPVFAMLILGAAFVLVPAAMWPSVPLVVEKERVGVAFGIMTMIQNVGLMAFPVLNGKLRVMTGDYTASQVMFASLGALGLFFALGLLRADRRAGGVLERPHAG